MPKPLAVDKSIIQALFIQGFRPDEISKKTGVQPGTIRVWSRRYGWLPAKQQASELLSRSVSTQAIIAPLLAKSVAKASNAVRQGLAETMLNSLPALKAAKAPTSLASIAQQQEKLAPLVDNARKLFGWDNERVSQSVVSVASLDSAAALESAPSQQAIDVPTDASPAQNNDSLQSPTPQDPGATPL